MSATGSANSNMIDLILAVAKTIGAAHRAVSLSELYDAYMAANPGIGKGSSRGSFDATVSYHCINMRSRFPKPQDKHQSAYWLTHPVFKRLTRGQYMLLSADEMARFNRCVEAKNPIIYQDEYDVDTLPD